MVPVDDDVVDTWNGLPLGGRFGSEGVASLGSVLNATVVDARHED